MSSKRRRERGWRERIDGWIFDSYPASAEQLGICRILYASFGLLVMGIPSYGWIASIPDALFRPPLSVAALFPAPPSEALLGAFGSLLTVLNWALLVGYRTRIASVSLALVGMTAESFGVSFGAITHSRHFYLMLPLLMSFSNWGAALSIDAWRRSPDDREPAVHTWPITLMSVLLGFGMFTAGWPKVLGGWLDPATSAVREKIFYWYFVEKHRVFAGFFIDLESPLLWEILDWGTVAFELGFLVAVLRPPVFLAFSGVALVFHTMTVLTLNIGFTHQLIVYVLFCAPFLSLHRALVSALQWLFRPALAVALCVAYLGLRLAELPVTLPAVVTWLGLPPFDTPARHHVATLGIHLASLAVGAWIALSRGRHLWAALHAAQRR